MQLSKEKWSSETLIAVLISKSANECGPAEFVRGVYCDCRASNSKSIWNSAVAVDKKLAAPRRQSYGILEVAFVIPPSKNLVNTVFLGKQ